MLTFETLIQTLPAQVVELAGARIQRAIEIASRSSNIYPTKDPQVYHVRSQSKPNTMHRVHTGEKSCTCMDSQKHKVCKHRIAVWLHTQIYSQAVAGIKQNHDDHYSQLLSKWEALSTKYGTMNVRLADLYAYTVPGVVTYNHPLQGEIEVPVLATKPHEVKGDLKIQVLAIFGTPFTEGLFNYKYFTVRFANFHITKNDIFKEL